MIVSISYRKVITPLLNEDATETVLYECLFYAHKMQHTYADLINGGLRESSHWTLSIY